MDSPGQGRHSKSLFCMIADTVGELQSCPSLAMSLGWLHQSPSMEVLLGTAISPCAFATSPCVKSLSSFLVAPFGTERPQ